MQFGGLDIAINHSAIVVLDERGELVDLRYLTAQRTSHERDPARSAYYEPPGTKLVPDPHANDMDRLANAWRVYRRFLDAVAIDFAYIEGYAYGTRKGELTGEIAGIVKLNLWGRGVPFRIMDVSSVKMFAAHNGAADKPEIMAAVQARWGQDFSRYNRTWKPGKRKAKEGEPEPPPPAPPKDLTQTQEDLSDAYVLARMCWVEWMIRAGRMQLSDLEHEKERQVYLRTTKAQPVNILAAEWTSLAAIP
jgi:hypothetical protein